MEGPALGGEGDYVGLMGAGAGRRNEREFVDEPELIHSHERRVVHHLRFGGVRP
jgi:hypothetical protein